MDREPVSELNNARILVFGASGGLGAPVTTRLASAGACLAVSGRSADALTATDAYVITADLRHADSARTVLAEAAAELGGLDGIVIAAGVAASASRHADRKYASSTFGRHTPKPDWQHGRSLGTHRTYRQA